MLDRIIIAGSGGQGIQFAGQLIALAAVTQGLEATYVPAYGAERRGGKSFCTVVVGDHFINAPVFQEADVLIALDQRARNEYGRMVKDTGIILADKTLAPQPADQESARVLLIDAYDQSLPLRQDKKTSVQNLLMLGAYVGLGRGVTMESVKQVLEQKSRKKPHLLQSNLKALDLGAAMTVVGQTL